MLPQCSPSRVTPAKSTLIKLTQSYLSEVTWGERRLEGQAAHAVLYACWFLSTGACDLDVDFLDWHKICPMTYEAHALER
jgi:hypothetical protein